MSYKNKNRCPYENHNRCSYEDAHVAVQKGGLCVYFQVHVCFEYIHAYIFEQGVQSPCHEFEVTAGAQSQIFAAHKDSTVATHRSRVPA